MARSEEVGQKSVRRTMRAGSAPRQRRFPAHYPGQHQISPVQGLQAGETKTDQPNIDIPLRSGVVTYALLYHYGN